MNLSTVREPEAFSADYAEFESTRRYEAEVDSTMRTFGFSRTEAITFLNDENSLDGEALADYFDQFTPEYIDETYSKFVSDCAGEVESESH